MGWFVPVFCFITSFLELKFCQAFNKANTSAPHFGKLLYERRGFYSYKKLTEDTRDFIGQLREVKIAINKVRQSIETLLSHCAVDNATRPPFSLTHCFCTSIAAFNVAIEEASSICMDDFI